MTAPGGGEPYRDQPGPWQPYQHPPVDPQAPVNYPEYPYPQPPQQPPPYGSYPPPPPYGFPSPPQYPGHYDPYLGYQAQQTNGAQVVAGQYSTGETYGALYPKGSANEDNFNKIIQALIDDGTLKKLSAKYLAAAWGSDPSTVPYFQP